MSLKEYIESKNEMKKLKVTSFASLGISCVLASEMILTSSNNFIATLTGIILAGVALDRIGNAVWEKYLINKNKEILNLEKEIPENSPVYKNLEMDAKNINNDNAPIGKVLDSIREIRVVNEINQAHKNNLNHN